MKPAVDVNSNNPSRTVRALAFLVALGAANALWALFLWAELLLTRLGQKPFCALGEGADCGSLWDGGFASAIHSTTGVPVAGWGLAFGVVSILIPLFALVKVASQQDGRAMVTATRVLGGFGAIGVVVLASIAAASGIFCLGCTVTYLITAVYCGVAFALLPRGLEELPKAAGTTVLAFAAAFLVLLYPGIQTPKSKASAEKDAMATVNNTGSSTTGQPSGQKPAQGPAKTDPAAAEQQRAMEQTAPGTPEAIARARAFLSSLAPDMRQAVSDSVHIWRTGHDIPVRPARAVIGDPNAPVRITDFTDARCGHCAQFHSTLKEILGAVPGNAFNLEARHFPLDQVCNSEVQRQNPDPASCLAARIEVCAEGHPRAFELAGLMFDAGQNLTSDKVWKIADAILPHKETEACVNDPATQAKINDDIAWAKAHELEGTPLVLINGKKATSFGPFVFAAILSGGDPQSSVWEGLPPPKVGAHIH